MKDATEQAIIAASGTITKTAGTATAATGTAGFWAFVLDHQQPIFLILAIAGFAVTMISASINARYQKKRDEREHLDFLSREKRETIEHEKKVAVYDYQLQQMAENLDHKRLAEDQ